MGTVVFLRRPGMNKMDCAWCCGSQSEATGLAKFLRENGMLSAHNVQAIEVISLQEHENMPNIIESKR